jgi:hypothetical protein
MPVYAKSRVGDLRLTLTSGGEVVDTQFAATRSEAGRIAIAMIAARNGMYDGDTLTVAEDQDAKLPRADGPGDQSPFQKSRIQGFYGSYGVLQTAGGPDIVNAMKNVPREDAAV